MKNLTKQDCRKNSYQKVSFQVKLEIVQRVNNGQISVNHAAKEYGISRATIRTDRDSCAGRCILSSYPTVPHPDG